MKFNASIDDNFASFFDRENDNYVFVESTDNENFDVTIATASGATLIGTVSAKNNEELNAKLGALYQGFMMKNERDS
ncbi:hypothetical protein [Vibrio harveyi]